MAVGGPRAKLSDQVVAAIQAEILSGRYAPGDRLPTEAALCARHGVSRSVVRDALRSLASLGLVVVRHGHGIEVAEPNGDAITMATVLLLARSGVTMGDLVAARAFLEVALASEAAARGTPDDWAAMRRALDGMAEAAGRGDGQATERQHREFHLGLLRAVHLPALEVVLGPVQQVMSLGSLPDHFDDMRHWGPELHVPILEALERGDGEAARGAMFDHFAFARDGTVSEFLSAVFGTGPAAARYEALLAGE